MRIEEHCGGLSEVGTGIKELKEGWLHMHDGARGDPCTVHVRPPMHCYQESALQVLRRTCTYFGARTGILISNISYSKVNNLLF